MRQLLMCLTALAAFAGHASPASSGAADGRPQFLHDSEEHRSVTCDRCHLVSTEVPDVVDFPPHQPCVSCHNFAEKAMEDGAAYCQVCHEAGQLSAADTRMIAFPDRLASTDFMLPFLHQPHLKDSDKTPASLSGPLQCTDCHQAGNLELDPMVSDTTLAHHKPSELPVEAAHSGCFSCHGQQPLAEPAMTSCDGCHTLPVAAQAETVSVASAGLHRFRHADHLFDIRPKKKEALQSGQRVDLCRECHSPLLEESEVDVALSATASFVESKICESCHLGTMGLPEPLDPKLLETLHGR